MLATNDRGGELPPFPAGVVQPDQRKSAAALHKEEVHT
jgi:hypothetical protein